MEPKLTLKLRELLINYRQEKEIEEYKAFYKKYFTGLRNRNTILTELAALNQKFALKNPAVVTYLDKDYISLVSEGKALIQKHFPKPVLDLYENPLPPTTSKNDPEFNNILLNILSILVKGFEAMRQQNQQDFNYKKNLLAFIYATYLSYGLHPNILKRDPAIHKRFNLIITHVYGSRKPLQDLKYLLSYEELYTQFLKLYLIRKPVKFGGKLIPFEKIREVNISTTLFKDDEIPLFALKNNFRWDNQHKDIERFIGYCLNETETYHPNPFDTTSYSKELNLLLIAQAKEFLLSYPDAAKLYNQALKNFEGNINERHILDDLRLSLELLLKKVLSNNKSMENQLPALGKHIKDKGSSPEITNMFHKILDYYTGYHNTYVKHSDKVNNNEIEFMINLTTTFMRFIVS